MMDGDQSVGWLVVVRLRDVVCCSRLCVKVLSSSASSRHAALISSVNCSPSNSTVPEVQVLFYCYVLL
jgi:hypothetical protein